MPLYEPSPLCGYSTDLVKYQLYSEDGGLPPDWIQINPNNHQIEVVVEEEEYGEDVYGQTFTFELKASFLDGFEEVQSFKIVFPSATVEEVIEEIEEEEDDEETDVEIIVDNGSNYS